MERTYYINRRCRIQCDDQWSYTWLEIGENLVDLTENPFKYNERPLQKLSKESLI